MVNHDRIYTIEVKYIDGAFNLKIHIENGNNLTPDE